jgi:RNA polymerase sigma-70 factor (ECF subfamily)
MENQATCAHHRGVGQGMVGPQPGSDTALDLAEIFRVHGTALLRRARWLTRKESDGHDLVQTTIEHALRSPARHRVGRATALRWLYAIMHNAFMDDRRAAGVRRWVSLGCTSFDVAVEEEPVALPRWRSIDDEVLARCCDRLPPEMRAIFAAHAAGASYAELARRLDLPVATVGTRLMRARRRLRLMLDEGFANPPPAAGTIQSPAR